MKNDFVRKLSKNVGWIFEYLLSSIGKKQTMGFAGAGLVGFLLGHVGGNLQLLNPDLAAAQASYNAYTKFLTGLGPTLWAIEAGLTAILLYHAGVAVKLRLENLKAAGCRRYAVRAHKGKASPAAFTMLCSGSIILAFLVHHVATFKFGAYYLYQDASGAIIRDMWLTTALSFANPWIAGAYALAFLAIGAHLAHAVPSLFRTFGLVHPKWTPIFNVGGVLCAVAIFGGLSLVAVCTSWRVNTPEGKALIEQSRAAQVQLQQIQKAEVGK